METLFNSRFDEIILNKQTEILYHVTKPETVKMYEHEFKEMLLNWKKHVFTINPRLILIDNLQFLFPISPDLQIWAAENVGNPILSLDSVQKLCFVMPEEFIARLSISQLTDEANAISDNTQMKYFSNKVEASGWLLSN